MTDSHGNDQTFGAWLRERLHERHLTQGQFAKMVGVSRYSIVAYLIERRKPSPETAAKIADALGVPRAEVYHRADHYVQDHLVPSATGQAVTGRSRVTDTAYIRFVPIVGVAPADTMRYASEVGTFMPLPASSIAGIVMPEIVIASGNCLVDRHIRDGTYLILETHEDALDNLKSGEIVLVRVGEDVTLKEWWPDTDGVVLRAAAPGHQPIHLSYEELEQESAEVKGVVRKWLQIGDV